MESVEMTARTTEEAIELGLRQLGARREEVIIEVVSKGKTGILGFGSELARVRVTMLPASQGLAREAKEVVDKLLSAMKVNAIASIGRPSPEAPSTMVINIEGEDSGLLIGRRGETLQAFQFMVNSLLSHQHGESVFVFLDVEHYKERRHGALRNLALRMAERVANSGRAVTLEFMPPAERRIIHMALADDPRVMTQSIGDRDGRKVTIVPKRDYRSRGHTEERQDAPHPQEAQRKVSEVPEPLEEDSPL